MIREITDQSTWENFVLRLNPNTFLHSWEWGQVQRQAGEGVRYLGIFDGEEQIGAALVLIINARRGRHYLLPHGPLFASPDHWQRFLPEVVTHLRQQAREDGAVALRVAPLLEDSARARELFRKLGFRDAPMHVHAELTWVLDIAKSDEELLAGMRKTTRHAIRRAEDAALDVEVVRPERMLDIFWPLYEQTARRHEFVVYSRATLEVQLREFGERGRVLGVMAKHKGRAVAAAICFHYGNTVFYYHGASERLPASVPAAQLVQWRAIQEARKRGATRYNFWGIARDDEPRHPFAGITTFKRGFGGHAIDYLHAQDLPLSIGYWRLWAIEMWRKWRRGF